MGEVNIGDRFILKGEPCIVNDFRDYSLFYSNLSKQYDTGMLVDDFAGFITAGIIEHPLDGIGEAKWIQKLRKS